MNRAIIPAALVVLNVLCGCTHQHLRINTLAQVRTVPNLQQQQVLDNLAMFVANPESLPFYSIAGGGTTAINDQLGNSENLSYTRVMFDAWSMMFSGSREMSDSRRVSGALTVFPKSCRSKHFGSSLTGMI